MFTNAFVVQTFVHLKSQNSFIAHSNKNFHAINFSLASHQRYIFIDLILYQIIFLQDYLGSWFFSLMNYCKMILHGLLLRKSLLTNVTFEWLFSFMNSFNMWFHDLFLRKFVVTKVIFKGFFSSWSIETCVFMSPFWEKL